MSKAFSFLLSPVFLFLHPFQTKSHEYAEAHVRLSHNTALLSFFQVPAKGGLSYTLPEKSSRFPCTIGCCDS
jgi:hypothetical protein